MKQKYDAVIIGSGIAGMYCALSLEPSVSALVLAKGRLGLSNSALAQGGVAAVLDPEDDCFEFHIKDTLIAGRNENDPAAVKMLVEEGPSDVARLIDLGVDFDKDDNGNIIRTLEGGHSRRRIFHHKDKTGFEIMEKLTARLMEKENIDAVEYAPVYAVTPIDGGFCVEFLTEGGPDRVVCNGVVFATGGIGRVYKYTTNSSIATGDGIRFAAELGAEIKNLSYIQFHPTAFEGENSNERFLISEAVRGEGAYLLNCNKERFMHRYDERLELAPRDVVSRSIILESRRTGSRKFYLDITHRGAEYLLNRFPAISSKCRECGIDMTKEFIPIFPCQHYLMGGIHTDLNAWTGVEGVYAAGECTNTGVHGRNRLASNSLLEALVFGRHAAVSIMSDVTFNDIRCSKLPDNYRYGAPLTKGIVEKIQDIMQKSYFVIPDTDALYSGMGRMEEILNRLKTGNFSTTREYIEALSLATVGDIVLKEVYNR